jgi:hypothetical protein
MKNFLFTAVLAMIVIAANAQTIKPGVGLNFANVSNVSDVKANGNTGWQVGGSIAFGNKFYFEPGIFFQSKSADFKSDDVNDFEDIKAQFSGFRVPVAVGLNILGNDDSTIALRVFGGGSGYFITNTSDDLKNIDVNKAQWGVFAGAGLDFWILFLDLSYEWSVTDIQQDVTQIDFGKTNGLFATAGLRINLSK